MVSERRRGKDELRQLEHIAKASTHLERLPDNNASARPHLGGQPTYNAKVHVHVEAMLAPDPIWEDSPSTMLKYMCM